jgi:hypothetical protein
MSVIRRHVVRPVLLFALLPAATACDRPRPPPPSGICVALLTRELPDARVIEIADANDRTELRYSRKAADGETVAGTFSCRFELAESGHYRVRSAALDGRPLIAADLAVVNADLLLRDMDRAGRAGVSAAR